MTRWDHHDASLGWGGGVSAWIGYDAWLAEQISMGPSLRGFVAWTKHGDATIGTQSLALSWSGLWQ